MRPGGRHRPAATEDGAVAVIAAVMLTVLLLLAAIVVDLGLLRSDRTASQSAADMAAAGAVVNYAPGSAGSAQQACRDALALALDNLHGGSAGASPVEGAACATEFPSSFDASCPATTGRAVYRSGDHLITIVAPVSDGDALMGTQAVVGTVDGAPCQRVGVSISRDRDLFFGGFAGISQSTTNRGAVGRVAIDDEDGDTASLIVLRRVPTTGNDGACTTLESQGNFTRIRVLDHVAADGAISPGNITVDTDAGSCNAQRVVRSSSSQGITAGGDLIVHNEQLNPGDPRSVSPGLDQPVLPGPRVTRSPVDHLYNCLPGGYPSGQDWSPERDPDQDIEDCPTEDLPAYVQLLQNSLGGIDGASPGWATFPDDFEDLGATCTNNDDLDIAPADIGGLRNLYVDCDLSGGSGLVGGGEVVEFSGFDNIVFRREMQQASSGTLRINGPAGTGTTVYIQRGSLEHANGQVLLDNTFVYIQAPRSVPSNEDQHVLIGGSTGSRYAHRALLKAAGDNCVVNGGIPNAACFAPLAIWSNGDDENNLQSNNSRGGIVGSVFTPSSAMKLRTGGADSEAPCTVDAPSFEELRTSASAGLNLEAAQFFARTLDNSGGGTLRMCPNPDSTIEIPIRSIRLIR